MRMRVGEPWYFYALDHCEESPDTAWSRLEDIDTRMPLVPFVGHIVKVTKDAVGLAVSCHDGQATTPFFILRSTIIASGKIKLPPKRRNPKPSGGEE